MSRSAGSRRWRATIDELGRVLRSKLTRGRDVYRSPQEIALRNAAEELGVSLGDYYPDDVDLHDPTASVSAERLDASREELLVYIERLATNRRRTRRQRRFVVAAIAMLAPVVVGLSVASPWKGARDRVPETQADVIARVPHMRLGAGRLPVRGTSVEMRLRQGGQFLVSSAYVDQHGDVCRATFQQTGAISELKSRSGCIAAGRLTSALLRTPALRISVETEEEAVVVQGYARADIEAIVARGRDPGIEVDLSPVWEPRYGAIRGPRVRAFLVRIPVERRIGVLEELHKHRLLAAFPRDQVVVVRDLSDAGQGPKETTLVDPISR